LDKTSNASERTKSSQMPQNLVQESLMIPKHRFDCVNLCLKETKQVLQCKTQESEKLKHLMAELELTLLHARVETALAINRAKNITAAKALIDFSALKLSDNGITIGLDEQISTIKQKQPFLFENAESTMYVLVPVKCGDAIEKSITNYVKTTRSNKQ